MKKLFTFFALSAIVLGMASCGDGNDPEANKVPEGALKGKFSVENGKQVYFSKGNLYYDGIAKKYYFFDQQWDFIGNKADYSTLDRTFDLFGWGTGENPLVTSVYSSDYPSFNEWGDNPIVNGGDAPELWRTLKSDEWYYICHEREDAEKLIGLGTVNGVKGLIIMPDGWQQISGVPTFVPVENSKMKWDTHTQRYIDDTESLDYYGENNFSGKKWDAMEDSGALFLPAVGYRSGTSVYDPGKLGNYWCKDKGEGSVIRELYFTENRIEPQGGASKPCGQSVRLVWKIAE